MQYRLSEFSLALPRLHESSVPAAAGDHYRRHDDDAARREGGAAAGRGCRGPPGLASASAVVSVRRSGAPGAGGMGWRVGVRGVARRWHLRIVAGCGGRGAGGGPGGQASDRGGPNPAGTSNILVRTGLVAATTRRTPTAHDLKPGWPARRGTGQAHVF